MFAKILLVFILVSPDGKGYADFVNTYDTMAECEAAAKEQKKRGLQLDSSAYYFSVCVMPKPVKSIDA